MQKERDPKHCFTGLEPQQYKSVVAHNCSMDNQRAPIFPSGFGEGEGGGLTQVNRVNAEKPKTLHTSLLAIRGRAIDGVCGATFDKPELGRKEDLIALSRPFEPFSQEFLVIAIETLLVWLAQSLIDIILETLTRSYPRRFLLAQGRDRGLQIVPRRRELIRRSDGTYPSGQSLGPVRVCHSCPVCGTGQAWPAY